jgi:hypothetical protein
LKDILVQAAFESKVLKPGNHLIGSRLKPGAFKLWVKLDSSCTCPTTGTVIDTPIRLLFTCPGAAVQVEFERQTLKPGFHFIGQGLKPGAFKLWVN